MDNQIIMDNFNKRTLFVKVKRINETLGYMVHPKHINARKLGAIGIVKNWVPGHGGDVWFVQHSNDSNDIGAYTFTELELHGELNPPSV